MTVLILILVGVFLYPYVFGGQLCKYSYGNDSVVYAESMGLDSPHKLSKEVLSYLDELAMSRVSLFIRGGQMTLLAGLMAVIAIALIKKKRSHVWLGFAIFLLILFSQYDSFCLTVIKQQDADIYETDIYPESETIRLLQGDSAIFRVLCSDSSISKLNESRYPEFFPEKLSVRGIQTVRGYNPTILKYYAEYINTMVGFPPEADVGGCLYLPFAWKMNRRMMNELNVKYLLTYFDPPPPGWLSGGSFGQGAQGVPEP